jgi:predicted transposase YbfD/YdcC
MNLIYYYLLEIVMRETSIHKHFSGIQDHRVNRTKKHPLINIIFIALCAVICGAEDWVSIERFGNMRFDWLSQFLDLSAGIPSHDTFNRVFGLIDSQSFARQFMLWAECLAEKLKKVVSFDGKSMRATKNITEGLGPLHLVNVWCSENQLVLGQELVSNKSNEITAIPKLLELLELEGATVTIDAMGTQKEISKLIIAKKANYVLALKGNHGNLHADVELYFQSVLSGKLTVKSYEHKVIEKDHGRIEERHYYTLPLPKGLRAEGWEQLNSITMVENKRTIREETSAELQYYISNIHAKAHQEIADAIRTHWQVENCLHWRLDVSFNEDRWKSKLGNAGSNMALINKMALNLLKMEKTAKVGIKNRRLMAGWDENYLTKVLLAVKN